MATRKVTTRKTDIRTLVLQQNPKHYSEAEPSYQFRTRLFTRRREYGYDTALYPSNKLYPSETLNPAS